MYRTKYVTTEVEVDIDLDDFETDDLVTELKRRGFDFSKYVEETNAFDDAIWYFQHGNIKEALVLIERAVPDFAGLSKYVN